MRRIIRHNRPLIHFSFVLTLMWAAIVDSMAFAAATHGMNSAIRGVAHSTVATTTTPLHLVARTGSVEGPIPYIVIEPAEGPPDLPLVIALHGRGSTNERFVRLLEALQLPARIIVGNGPMPWGMKGGRRWFDLAAANRDQQIAKRVDDLVVLSDKLEAQWPKAPKATLLGFSQGGILALHALLEHPERWRAVIALSADLRAPLLGRFVTQAVPTLLTVGMRDRIIMPDRSYAAAWTLKALGHQPEVFSFPGGHTVSPAVRRRISEFLKSLP